jgi:hypothetical protein
MRKMVERQRLDVERRADLLLAYARLAGEEHDLKRLWGDANLAEKLKISGRFGEILDAKLRLRKLILEPDLIFS